MRKTVPTKENAGKYLSKDNTIMEDTNYEKNRAMLLVIASLLSILCLTMFIPTEFSVPLFAPVVIIFDSKVNLYGFKFKSECSGNIM